MNVSGASLRAGAWSAREIDDVFSYFLRLCINIYCVEQEIPNHDIIQH